MMKKMILSFCALLLSPALFAGAAELSIDEKDTIYIDKVRISPSLSERAERNGTSLALQRGADLVEIELTPALNATRIFQLVERKELSTLEEEQELSKSGAVDAESRFAASAGRISGAKFVLIPTLVAFDDVTSVRHYAATGRLDQTRNLYFAATIKIVNTKTGAILSEVPSVQLQQIDVRRNLSADDVSGREEFLVAQAKEVARQLAQSAVSVLRPARILAVSGKQILVNRGSEAGFSVGDQLEVFAVTNVRDEESGETYRNEFSVGQARIIRIDKKQSFAMIDGDDLGIVAGGIVKIFHAGNRGNKREGDAATPSTETPGSSEKPLRWQD